MINRILYILTFTLLFSSCNREGNKIMASDPLEIQPFDKRLFALINSEDWSLQDSILKEFPEMIEITGKAIFNLSPWETDDFFNQLENYYSEPTLYSLYKDAIIKYNDVSEIEKDLGVGFGYLWSVLPSLTMPKVYMHVSGLNQNVLVGESLLSISIDKYLGKDYPLYQDYFYDYQLEKMQPSHIVPDYMTGWLMSEYPFEGKENLLIDRMIYEGKILFLISQALPGQKAKELLGYTEENYKWCEEHEKEIWKSIIERKHLYTPDIVTTTKYFEDRPSTFLSSDAPGNIGKWMGFKIIQRYMKRTGSSPEDLMLQKDSQEILSLSKYKP